MNRTVHNAARTQEGGFVRLPFIWRKHLLGALTEENFACVVLRLVYDAVGRDYNLADIFRGEFPSNVRKSDAADANRLICD